MQNVVFDFLFYLNLGKRVPQIQQFNLLGILIISSMENYGPTNFAKIAVVYIVINHVLVCIGSTRCNHASKKLWTHLVLFVVFSFPNKQAICHGQYKLSTTTIAWTYLVVSDEPNIRSLPPSPEVLIEKTSTLNPIKCVAIGKPNPNVAWYKQGNVTPLTEGNGTAEIRFAVVNREQAGNYTSKDENVAGIAESVVEIAVHCKRIFYWNLALRNSS